LRVGVEIGVADPFLQVFATTPSIVTGKAVADPGGAIDLGADNQ
jgi:hypothetical protein